MLWQWQETCCSRFRPQPSRATPGRLLDSSDVIEVGAPRPAPNVRYACILNAYGEQGLGLAEERSLLEMGDADEEEGAARLATESLWSVTFCDPWELPIAEHDLWLDEGLPSDPTGRIPAAVQYGPKRRVRRASPKMRAFLEAEEAWRETPGALDWLAGAVESDRGAPHREVAPAIARDARVTRGDCTKLSRRCPPASSSVRRGISGSPR